MPLNLEEKFKTHCNTRNLELNSNQVILVLKSIPYSDLGPFLNPNGPEIKSVKGLVPGFKSTL